VTGPPVRCLFALPFLHLGVGRLVVDLMRELVERETPCGLVTCGWQGELGDDPALVAEVRRRGISIAHADLFSRNALVHRQASARVGERCEAWNASVVHAFTAMAAAAALPYRPVVATVVGWSPEKAAWQKQMDVLSLERTAVLTAVSDAMAAELRQAGLGRTDVRVIHNGVRVPPRPARFLASPRAPVRVLGVMAHLVARKGVDVLLRALGKLNGGAFHRLVIAGEGEAASDLRRLHAELALATPVEWMGAQHVESFLDRVDAVIVPSRSDALPLILLQAMAAGVPVVASAVGGIPEAVRPGVDGLLVAPGAVDALAEALRALAADPCAARRRALRARARVADFFSIERTVGEYERCYTRALAWRTAASSGRARTHDPEAGVRHEGVVP
jgi:glycosyltransferase involved in cell wall biosynthesis